MPRHYWWKKRGFDPPYHWTEQMEQACQEAPGDRLLPWCPDWLLGLAVLLALALVVWGSDSLGRVVETLGLHWPGR